MRMVDAFFGGAEAVRKALVEAMKRRRVQLGLSHKMADLICILGDDAELPSFVELEANPQLVNSKVFSLASFALDLALDEILPLDLSRDQEGRLGLVLEDMEDKRASLVAGVGDGDVPPEDKARVYVLLKALEEIDSP